mmetsp:Transcript_38659/g.87827  ORF Transcript_38659/g.87827 Transcript_38659/m.87827 type:complete len:283 (-) Transcript_38659:1592-2440(-)
MSSTSSRGQLVFRSSLLYVWVTRGPFGRLTKSLCDFGDMTPHTLVGGAQTTLTARASVRADRRNDPREALGPRGDTQSRPPEALDRCTGVTGAVGTARNTRHHSWSCIHDYGGEGVKHLAAQWLERDCESAAVRGGVNRAEALLAAAEAAVDCAHSAVDRKLALLTATVLHGTVQAAAALIVRSITPNRCRDFPAGRHSGKRQKLCSIRRISIAKPCARCQSRVELAEEELARCKEAQAATRETLAAVRGGQSGDKEDSDGDEWECGASTRPCASSSMSARR